MLSSFLPKSKYKEKLKKYVHKEAATEKNARKLKQFLQFSKSPEEHPAVAGGLQTKQKIADMDCFLLNGKPRNGAHLLLLVVVKGRERRDYKTMQRRLHDNPNRAWHHRQAQARWTTLIESWGSWGSSAKGSWGSSGR